MAADTRPTTPGARAATVLVAALLPLAVLGLLLAGLWSPQDRLETVRAAIVNHDEPVEVEGETVPLGRQLAAGLVDGEGAESNYTWELTDTARAAEGLDDGSYGAVVTIPEDFSAAATSISDEEGEPRQAVVDVATAEDGRVLDDALARIVATTAADVLAGTVTETYVDNLLLGYDTLGEELGEAADGADQLAEGAGNAADAAGELADGAGQLTTGAEEAAAGAGELASGAGELADGAAGLSGGLGELSQGAAELSGGARELAGGAGASAGGARELAAGAGEMSEAAAQTAEGAAAVAEGLEQYVIAAYGIREAVGCPPDGSGQEPHCLALEEALEAAVGPLAELQTGAAGVAEGTAGLSAGTAELAEGMTGLAGGLDTLSGGAAELSGGAGELASGAEELSGGAGTLADGAGELSAGTSGLADGVAELAGGAGDLTEGTEGLATGIGELAEGNAELAAGLHEAAEQLPRHDETERARLAEVASDPVRGPGMDGLGSGSSGALFTVIALWLGALVLMLVLPAVPARALGSTRPAPELALRAFGPPAAVGAATGGAAGAILAAVEGAGAGGWTALILLGALVSVCFVAVNQALVALLGHAGRAGSILVAIVALATGVVATAPDWIVLTGVVLPVGPAVDVLVAVVTGAGGFLAPLVFLLAWAAAGVGLSALAAARRRVVPVRRLAG